MAAEFETYNTGNEWRWRLQAGNNRIVADSGEGYHNYADCIQTINWIKANAATLPIR